MCNENKVQETLTPHIYKKNEEYTVEIEDVGTGGEGIAKIDGYTLFVKDAVRGDVCRVRITKAHDNFAFTKLMEVIKPSPHRVTPVCPVARRCGGCKVMAADYSEQLRFKENKVKTNIEKIGKVTDFTIYPIIGMETPYHYRNKAQFPIGLNDKGELVSGFYAGRTHVIIENEKCYLGVEENEEILRIIKEFMAEKNIAPYDEVTLKGLIRYVMIRKAFVTGEIMVCIIINGNKIPDQEELVERLSQVKGMTSISLSINLCNTNVIMGKVMENIYGRKYIVDYIKDIKFNISPKSFFQVNPVQTEKLYETALEYAGLTGNETVWDLYCGIGTISLFLARSAKKVYGVEIISDAIRDARNNAKMNNITNAEFFVGKAEEVLPEYYAKHGCYADVIVVDPPRKGCDTALLDTVIKMQPEKMVYVSCDSATLARDIRYMTEHGYELKKVQPVDMFPHTEHVETVVLLSKLKQKPDDYINVTIELDDVDITSAETKATYDEIKKYVFEHNAGMKVSNLYISQVKRKYGIEVGKNYNLPKNEDSRQPQCPEDKERAIVEALEHFKMIQQE